LKGKGQFWGVNLRCVEVRTVIEMSFGVVSDVGPDIHELDGSSHGLRGRGCFWCGFWHCSAFLSNTLQWRHGYTDILIDNQLICE